MARNPQGNSAAPSLAALRDSQPLD